MPIPAVTEAVYRAHIDAFGEPDLALTFDATSASPGAVLALDRLMVPVWRPTVEHAFTTFATIGMSSRSLPRGGHRLELQLAIRAPMDERHEAQVARFLANVAGYPWDHDRVLDFGHTLLQPGPIPMFESCEAIFFHEGLMGGEWDRIEHATAEVRLLGVIPVTRVEADIARRSIAALYRHFEEAGIDVWSDRDAPLRSA